MQRDPVGYWDSMNLYQYTGNSPINFVDPLGLYWLKDWSDLSAGFGDTITFGITDWLRYKWNYGGSVDPCSGWYKGGQYTAYAAEIAVGAAEGIAIRNAEKQAAKKLLSKSAKQFDKNQQALIELAKESKRKGTTKSQAQQLREWAEEYNLPSRGPESHPNRPYGKNPHVHIGPIDHIPVNL